MYPEEMKFFIAAHNYELSNFGENKDIEKVTSKVENPQITRVTFHSDSQIYEIWDCESNYITFKAITNKENTDESNTLKRILRK